MMIVLAWLIYCFLIASVLTAGAWAWERGARWSGRPARWVWLGALTGSVALPWLLRVLPERGWTEAVPGPMQLLSMDALVVSGASAAQWSVQEAAVLLWVLMSAAVLAYVGATVLGLTRARRRWRAAEVDGSSVLVAAATGPAAVGIRRAMVVVPAWALELDGELRSLLMRHERAHVEAGDPRLLLAGVMLLAAMPWNPVVWLQLMRLRNAIELDCDARVLATGASPERYGSLLLEVGRRRSRHSLVLATFAEPRLLLEQRIRRIAQWPPERSRPRAALFTVAALLLFAGALSCDPVRVASPSNVAPAVPAIDGSDLLAATDTPPATPTFTPMTRRPELVNREEVMRALVRNYPPLLRDAGISGRPSIYVFVDTTGTVTRTMVARSSGYPALDEAALHVAGTMRFEPALNRARKVAVWIQLPIVFSTDGATRAAPVSRRRGDDPRPVPVEPAQRPAPLGAPQRTAISEKPVFTPMTDRPELLNRDEVHQTLVRNYPPLLRDAGIGGTPTVHFLIDRTGTVQKLLLAKSSGYPALDEAALRVARTMSFSAPLNRGTPVDVWVEIPVVFAAK
ncbi:MAG TPA: M56 family metallopeptidase [Longimicrobiales bacterium]